MLPEESVELDTPKLEQSNKNLVNDAVQHSIVFNLVEKFNQEAQGYESF